MQKNVILDELYRRRLTTYQYMPAYHVEPSNEVNFNQTPTALF